MGGVRKDGILQTDDVGSGGATPVTISSPIGPNIQAASVSVTLATDEDAIPVTLGAGSKTIITDGVDDAVIRPANSKPSFLNDTAIIAEPREVEAHNTAASTDNFISVGGWDQFQNISKKLPIRSEFDPIQKADTDPGVLVRPLNPVISFSQVFTANGTLAANMLRYNAASALISVIDGGAFNATLTPLLSDNLGTTNPTFVYKVSDGTRVTTLAVGEMYFATVAGATNLIIQCSSYVGGSATVRISPSPEPVGILTAHVNNADSVSGLNVNTKRDLTPSAPTVAAVGIASAQAVAAAATRKGLILRNLSNARISLGFGSAAVLDSGVTLYPRDSFEMNEYDFDLAAVNAIASAAASSLAIQEYLV